MLEAGVPMLDALPFVNPSVWKEVRIEEGDTPVEFARSARRYYQFTHYANITRQGAAPVADTPEALVEHVSRYLADRSLAEDGT